MDVFCDWLCACDCLHHFASHLRRRKMARTFIERRGELWLLILSSAVPSLLTQAGRSSVMSKKAQKENALLAPQQTLALHVVWRNGSREREGVPKVTGHSFLSPYIHSKQLYKTIYDIFFEERRSFWSPSFVYSICANFVLIMIFRIVILASRKSLY